MTPSLLARIAGIFSAGELSAVPALFATGYVDHQRPDWIEFDGPEEFIAIVSSARRSLADLRVRTSDVVRVGDVEAGVLHWAGVADDGTHVERRTVEILRITDEHVDEHWGLELSSSLAATTQNNDVEALLTALDEHPNHRMVEAALRATGWTKVAAGDWAIALRSPDGTMAARISPFDPTGPYTAALYREATATGQVPILYAHRRLAGGGDLQIMEWLDPVPEDIAAAVHRAIAERAPEYEELADTIHRVHQRAKAELPWCGPLDDNPSNIMRTSDGHLVVTCSTPTDRICTPPPQKTRISSSRGSRNTNGDTSPRSHSPAQADGHPEHKTQSAPASTRPRLAQTAIDDHSAGRHARLSRMDYQAALARLIRWAESTVAVRALVLTGSAAAQLTHPLSDRDLELYVTDSDSMLNDESWWDDLGEVLVVERLENPGWYPTRLVYYAGGKLDFTIIPADELSSRSYDRPYEVLIDKDDCAPPRVHTSPIADLPSAAEFSETLDWAYAAALMCAKAIVRDEPWSAKIRDRDLKDELLKIIEWDHQVRYGSSIDTRFLGSRMRQWMDDDVQAELTRCWARFDLEDTAIAMLASIALLARLATRTARALDYEPFPHARLHIEIQAILNSTDRQHYGHDQRRE